MSEDKLRTFSALPDNIPDYISLYDNPANPGGYTRLPLSEASVDMLESVCEAFRAAVFKKAGKIPET